jgi:hypothetical protein
MNDGGGKKFTSILALSMRAVNAPQVGSGSRSTMIASPTRVVKCDDGSSFPRKYTVKFLEVCHPFFFTDPGALKGVACQLVEMMAQ